MQEQGKKVLHLQHQGRVVVTPQQPIGPFLLHWLAGDPQPPYVLVPLSALHRGSWLHLVAGSGHDQLEQPSPQQVQRRSTKHLEEGLDVPVTELRPGLFSRFAVNRVVGFHELRNEAA
jgi:hypothetical protein